MVPKARIHPGSPQKSLAVLVSCEINVLGFSFHCLANELGGRVVHLHMKVSCLDLMWHLYSESENSSDAWPGS